MAIQVTAELDIEPIRRVVASLGRGVGRRVLQRALSGATRAMRTEVVNQTAQRVPLTKATIRKAVPAVRVDRGDLSAETKVITKAVPLIHFAAREGKRGVTLRVGKGGKRIRLKHAFIATMDSGHRGVFERDITKPPQKRKKPKYSGLPIKELFGRQVIQAANDETVKQLVIQRGSRTFVTEFERLVSVELAKR